MDEITAYYTEQIRHWVWSGFYTAAEVADMLAEQLADEEAATEPVAAQLQRIVSQALAAKQRAETTWPALTDCDRLAQAFAALPARGILALHHAGYDMSDGLAEVSEALAVRANSTVSANSLVQGYCFYHDQDLARALAGLGLWLAYGSLDNAAATKQLVGQQVQAALTEVGLVVEWSGNPETRLRLPRFNWQRRCSQ